MNKQYKYYWEDFPVGSVTEYGGVTLTKEDIIRYAKEFDPQPFHILSLIHISEPTRPY